MPNETARQYWRLLQSNPNLKKFLDLISWVEGAGYQTGWGNRYIPSLSWHPYAPRQFSIRDPVTGKPSTTSVAGRYQFQRGTWETVATALDLKDFSPQSQDIAAVYLIDKKRGQLQNVLSGNVSDAVQGLRNEWQGFVTKPLSAILQKFGGNSASTVTPNAAPQSAAVSFDPNVQVIGAKNRYLLAFAILVFVFIFAFKR